MISPPSCFHSTQEAGGGAAGSEGEGGLEGSHARGGGADAAGGRGGGVVRQDGAEADWGEMGYGPCRAMDGPSAVSSHLVRMGSRPGVRAIGIVMLVTFLTSRQARLPYLNVLR